MARTKGALNKPRPMSDFKWKGSKMTPEEILHVKNKIIDLLTDGSARTISAAAKILGINPRKISSWAYKDPDFKVAVESAYQITADEIEEKFRLHGNFIPQMMLLKRIRPEYKDNFRGEQANLALEALLRELTLIAQKNKPAAPALEAQEQIVEQTIEIPKLLQEIRVN